MTSHLILRVGFQTADDAQQACNPKGITAWDFTLNNGAAGWIPALDCQVNFTATIRPISDHNGSSLAAIILFNLISSMEPGFCLNATREQGAITDTVGNDLKFIPPIAGYNVFGLNYEFAEPLAPQTDATIPVTSLDYGSFGSIAATANIPFLGVETAHLEGNPDRYFAQVPVDENGNLIADSSTSDGNGALGNEGADSLPAGDGTPGDRLSRYEEYRGFKVSTDNEGAMVHKRLDLAKKDVFIWNVDDLNSEFLTSANLGAPARYVKGQYVEHTTRAVNFRWMSFHNGAQTAIKVTDGKYSALGEYWGRAWAVIDPWVPNNEGFCKVYVKTIRGTEKGAFPEVHLADDIDASITEIFVDEYLDKWRPSDGKFKIDSEVVRYDHWDESGFRDCTRGQNATSHTEGTKVSWFADPEEIIGIIFAHEAGHLMNLRAGSHVPETWQNIMVPYFPPGSWMNNGYWSVFRGADGDALDGYYRVRL